MISQTTSQTSEAEQRKIDREARQLYEAGADYKKWMRVKNWAERNFKLAVETHKTMFDFVRMVMTTAIIVAVALFWSPTFDAEHAKDTELNTGGLLIAHIFSVLTVLGIYGITLLLILATHRAAAYFAISSAARIGDTFQIRFTKRILKTLSSTVTACIVLSVIAIGASLAQQALKRVEKPEQKIEAANRI